MLNKNTLLSGLLAVSLSTLLSACGGGSSALQTTNTASPTSPHTLTARDLQRVDVLSANTTIQAPVVTSDANTITLSFHSANYRPGMHNQFFLNVDNNAATGFRFQNEAWDNAGTDYIVEDGNLFKSLSNNSSWDWNENVGDVSYSITGGSATGTTISVTIKKSLLEGLGSTIRAGFISRDSNWNVKAFYPISPIMQEYAINGTLPPAGPDTIAPVIKLTGLKTITTLVNHPFADPGANAHDNVDGNLTARIQKSSDVDISKQGTYHIVYSVSDQAGNTSSVTRTVKVVAQIADGITIDGHATEWQDIPALSNTPAGILKATETADTLYIMVQDETRPELDNTQIFIDVDSDSSTGFQFAGDIWNQGGADYMIENDHLDKAKSNSSSWAWDYNVAPIKISRGIDSVFGNVVEVAIPKSSLQGLGSTINIGYVHRDQNWQMNNVVPGSGMVSYSLNTNPPSTDTISANTRHALCNNPDIRTRQALPEGSLLDGYLYNGIKYVAKPESANNYSFWAQENGNNTQIGSFASDYKPALVSINGALFFRTGLRKIDEPRTIWRVKGSSLVVASKYSARYSNQNRYMTATLGSDSNYFWKSSFSPQGPGKTFISYNLSNSLVENKIISKLGSPYIQMHYENSKLYVANTENNVRTISIINDTTKSLEKIGSCGIPELPPEPVTIDVKHALCDNLNSPVAQPTASLENGITYAGKFYKMKQENAENYSLWVTNNNTTVKLQDFPSKGGKPRLISTNGALFFHTLPYDTPARNVRSTWRVDQNNVVTNILQESGRIQSRNSTPNIAFINNDNYFLRNYSSPLSTGTSSIRYNSDSDLVLKTIISFNKNSQSHPKLRMFYKEGKLYEADSGTNGRTIKLLNSATKQFDKVDTCN